MESNTPVLGYTIVERQWLPGVREEDHRHALAEIVHLEATGTNGRHDRGIRNITGLYTELAGADGEVGVCGCAVWVADDEEGDVFGVRAGEDGVGLGFDHFTGGDDNFAAVVGLLVRS